MGNHIYANKEFGKLELSAKEAKIAAKLFLKGLIGLGGAGESHRYMDSKAEARVQKEVFILIARATKDISDHDLPTTFDDCMLKAKEIVAEQKASR